MQSLWENEESYHPVLNTGEASNHFNQVQLPIRQKYSILNYRKFYWIFWGNNTKLNSIINFRWISFLLTLILNFQENLCLIIKERMDNFCLSWINFGNNISVTFGELRDDKVFFDVTLAYGDDQIKEKGEMIKLCEVITF